jgi:hypothetical protein
LLGRSLISLKNEPSKLVARYYLPAIQQPQPISVSYTNFASAEKTEFLIARKKGVVRPRARALPPDPSQNYERLSKTAAFSVEHLNVDPRSFSEELTTPEWNAMYRLAKLKKWTSFGLTELAQTEREYRRQVFNQEQRILDIPVRRHKTLAGFEASLRKMERSMCYEAALQKCPSLSLFEIS